MRVFQTEAKTHRLRLVSVFPLQVSRQTHDFVALFLADGELVIRSAANVQVVCVVGVEQRQRERIAVAAFLTLTDHERPITTTRPNHRLGRLARYVSHVPRLSTQLIQLQPQSVNQSINQSNFATPHKTWTADGGF